MIQSDEHIYSLRHAAGLVPGGAGGPEQDESSFGCQRCDWRCATGNSPAVGRQQLHTDSGSLL